MTLIEYLFFRPGPPGQAFDRWGAALLGAYAALTVAILLLGFVMRTLNSGHPVKDHIARQVIRYGVLLQLISPFILWLRWINLPGISPRILIFSHLIGEAVAAGYLLWWTRNRYPEQHGQYEWEEKKRSYLPRAAGRRK